MVETYFTFIIIAAILIGISAISWIGLSAVMTAGGPVVLAIICFVTGIITGIAAIVLAIISGGYYEMIKFSIPGSHIIIF